MRQPRRWVVTLLSSPNGDTMVSNGDPVYVEYGHGEFNAWPALWRSMGDMKRRGLFNSVVGVQEAQTPFLHAHGLCNEEAMIARFIATQTKGNRASFQIGTLKRGKNGCRHRDPKYGHAVDA